MGICYFSDLLVIEFIAAFGILKMFVKQKGLSCELRGTDNVQGQMIYYSSNIFKQDRSILEI